MRAHRLGAIAYVLWGVLHVGFGVGLLVALRGSGGDALALIGTARDRATIPDALGGVGEAVLAQHAWNLVAIGVAAAALGATLNWRNDRLGFWLNLAIVSVADLGFIAFVLAPGHIRVVDGLAGPALWIAGAALTAMGQAALRRERPAGRVARGAG